MKTYRIRSISPLTGKMSTGTRSFPKRQAEQIIKHANKKWKGIIHHWIQEEKTA